jgi:hypothetical protein
VWIAHCYALKPPPDGSSACLPPFRYRDKHNMEKEATTDEEKGRVLFKEFFADRGEENMIPEDVDYPQAKFKFTPISDSQVTRAIDRLKLLLEFRHLDRGFSGSLCFTEKLPRYPPSP